MLVLIARDNANPKAMDAAAMLSAYFLSQNISFDILDSEVLFSQITNRVLNDKTPHDYALAVVLGGDGTIIRTARYLAGQNCPILGINFGHLGFLANSGESGVVDLVSRALVHELYEDARANINIRVICEDEQDCVTNTAHEFFALNEIAARGDAGRLIKVSVDINDSKIANLFGDGLMIASATGSTAYSLSAGGPIVAPGFMGLIVQPIAPHTLTARTVLTNSNDIVRVDFSDDEKRDPVSLFVDGGNPLSLPAPVKCLYAMRGKTPTTLLYEDSSHFYNYTASKFYGISQSE